MHYYNEIDSYAADWLENLITAGLIPEGVVDRRDIRDVRPIDLRGFVGCHFFAGLGGWPYALRLAGWPDDRPVWTGSCPCQPFSAAGKGRGFADERHLWPAWHWLIQQSKPDIVFGEQVDKAVDWLDLVATDLEAEGYRIGAGVLPAAGAGAPHGRHRLWFVADTRSARTRRDARTSARAEAASAGAGDLNRRIGDASVARSAVGDVADDAVTGRGTQSQRSDRTDRRATSESGRLCDAGELGESGRSRLQERERVGRVQRETLDSSSWQTTLGSGDTFWSNAIWIDCRDGKQRPTEPSIQPLAYGVPARVGKLRAAGNAIVPYVAAEFIRAYLDC